VTLALVNVTVTTPWNRLVTGLEEKISVFTKMGPSRKFVTLSSEDVPVSWIGF